MSTVGIHLATAPSSATIDVSGAKNAALPLLLAALIVEGESTFTNVPNILDVHKMLSILRFLSVKVTEQCLHDTINIDATSLINRVIEPCLANQIRYSSLLLGILSGVFGRCEVALPGGCPFRRPLDIHLEGFMRLGYSVEDKGHSISLKKVSRRGTIQFSLRYPSVGATLNMVLCTIASNQSACFQNCAKEPEVTATLEYLLHCGAHITGIGSSTLVIRNHICLRGRKCRVIPDRIEAGTFALAAPLLGCNVTIRSFVGRHHKALLDALDRLGVPFDQNMFEDTITVYGKEIGSVRGILQEALPFPGFPTDLHPILATLCTRASCPSVINDTVIPSRFGYIQELEKLGALMITSGSRVYVHGYLECHSGGTVSCPDLRAGMACLLFAAAYKRKCIVQRFDQVLRGYSDIINKCQSLGVRIIFLDEGRA